MTGSSVDLRARAQAGPVHFMGIGGAGMCALAELLARAGGRVSGCDVKESGVLDDLRALGVTVDIGHDPDHVVGASALVVTAAVRPDHHELLAATEAGIPVLKRAQALGAWVREGRVVAVAGTHGKTTTTALAASMMDAAGLRPTALVGGRVAAWGGNLLRGSDELYVVEADEYDRSFLTLEPDVAVVTNVEADHLDVYGDMEGVRAGFHAFLERVRAGGRVIACADDPEAASLLVRAGDAGVSYGTSAGSMIRATDLRADEDGVRCTVWEEGRRVGTLRLALGGAHNLLNALGAAGAARACGAEWDAILRSAAAFRGVGRRFQRLGEVGGVVVLDDYAHHPTEIRATLAAAREAFPGRRLVVAFQPHLYSRTRDFAAEFGRALAMADEVWVTEVFPAREAPIPGVTGRLVADSVREAGGADVRYHADVDSLAEALAEALPPATVVLTVGAGSVERVGPALVGLLGVGAHA